MRFKAIPTLAVSTLFFFGLNTAQSSNVSLDSYLDMNIEELLSMEVTSVSKKKQPLSESAAAIFVITSKDIQRSGATSIPEALRLAPGLQVAKMDNNKWAISSRGFNAQFANKLLVLIDGRSVYTPSFSGVYWEDQDTVLADIDRIEVIRGPGATLWGANAVNGVINIITKSASDTVGGLVQISAGNEENGIVQLRYGTELSENVAARGYIKFVDRDASYSPDLDGQANDGWQSIRAGFRVDGKKNNYSWTIQGDSFSNDLDQTLNSIYIDPFDPANNPPNPFSPYREAFVADEIKAKGHNILGRWEQQLSEQSSATLQIYYDYTKRTELVLGQEKDTLDVDFQHHYGAITGHDIIWGLGYRRNDDDYTNSFMIAVDRPSKQSNELFSGFIQDEIELIDDELRLTMGAKLEHNTYTGLEVQPSVKMLWLPRAGISLWGSIAQAARTPSAVESRGTITTFIVPGLPPIRGANNADGSFDSEQLTAYEIGFRIQPTETTSLDVALFNNHYSDVATYETEEIYIFNNPFTPLAPPQIIPIMTNFDNKMEVTSRGIEVLFDWRIVAGWHLQSAYTYINTTTNKDNDSNDQYADLSVEGGTPEHHITLRSMYDLSDNVAFDVWAYYVDDLESTSLSAVRSSTIDSYTSINMRLSWNLLDKLELSLVGQNLFDNRHQEFVGEYYILRTEVERSIYGQVKYEF